MTATPSLGVNSWNPFLLMRFLFSEGFVLMFDSCGILLRWPTFIAWLNVHCNRCIWQSHEDGKTYLDNKMQWFLQYHPGTSGPQSQPALGCARLRRVDSSYLQFQLPTCFAFPCRLARAGKWRLSQLGGFRGARFGALLSSSLSWPSCGLPPPILC